MFCCLLVPDPTMYMLHHLYNMHCDRYRGLVTLANNIMLYFSLLGQIRLTCQKQSDQD